MQDVIEELYRHAAGRLGAYGYILTGSQHAGEELVQAAIVKVFVKRRLSNVRQAESYVRTTMRRIYIDTLRRDKLWARHMPSQARAELQPDDSEQVDERDAVARALASLPPRVRTAIVLHYLDDMAVADVAHAMRLSQGSVKRYLSDGRELLAPVLRVPAGERDESDDATVSVAVVERNTR